MLVSLICFLSAVSSLTALAADDVTISKAQQQFSTELLQTIAANTSYIKNVFFSPYSIYSCLLTVYVASAGKTEKSLQGFLRFDKSSIPDKSYIISTFFNSTPSVKEYTLTSVDRIYYSLDFKVKKDKQSQFGLKAGVFKKNNDREEEVNKWVSDNTKGIIQNFLHKGDINPGPTMVFVNAAYFKGYWESPLIGKQSKKPFTLHDGTVTETLFMSPNDDLFQSVTDQELKAQIISLPYKGKDITMIIILPTTKPQKNVSPPLADVVKKLTFKKFQAMLSTLEAQNYCTTDLLIPKFESEERYHLKPIFEALGDKELFTQTLDLTNLFEPGTQLKVDNIIHQAKVNVHENGTEAAAASATIIYGLAGESCPTTFHADHPFVYIIYDRKRHEVHYIGILNTLKK